MELCSNNHEEICFEEKTCPYCDMLESKDKEIDNLKEQIENLKNDIDSLNNEIEKLENS